LPEINHDHEPIRPGRCGLAVGKIDALRHSPMKLAGLSALTAAGIACLVLAVLLGTRWRWARREPVAQVT
jgi:hypothetical protein